MAVTLTSSPNSICCVDEPIAWGLSISSTGTPGTDVKCIAYRLTESGGGDITPDNEIAPVAASYNHIINFREEIKRSLNTKIPQLYVATIQDAAGVKKYILKYGETTLTLSSGSVTGFPPSSNSAEITVVNAANNGVWDDLDVFPAAKLLTFKPFQNYFNREFYDWVYIWGAGTVTILKDYTYSGGSYSGTTVVSLSTTAGKVNCVPIGYKHHAGLDGVYTYVVVITVNSVTTNHVYNLDYTSDGDYPSEIVYFDPGGGYTSISADVRQVGATATKEDVMLYKPVRSVTEGGRQLVNNEGYMTFRFSIRGARDNEQQEQLMRLIAAGNYYINLQTTRAQGLVKFEITEGLTNDIRKGERLEITGRVALPQTSANARYISN